MTTSLLSNINHMNQHRLMSYSALGPRHQHPIWQQQRPNFSPLKSPSDPSSSASSGLSKARYQTLLEVFLKLMKQRHSNESEKVWKLARRIERRLFHDAPSLDVYHDTLSMGRRLHHVVKTIMQEQQGQVQKGASSSTTTHNNPRRFTSTCEESSSGFSKTLSTNNSTSALTNQVKCFPLQSQHRLESNHSRNNNHQSRQGLLLEPQILFHVMQYLSGVDAFQSVVPLTPTTWTKLPATITSLRLTCVQLMAAFHTKIHAPRSSCNSSDHHVTYHMALSRCYRLRFLTVVNHPLVLSESGFPEEYGDSPHPRPTVDTASVLAQLAEVLKLQKPFPLLERLHLPDLLPSKGTSSVQPLLDTLRMNACPRLTDLNLSGNPLEDTNQVTSTLFRPPFFQQPQQHHASSSASSLSNQYQHPPQAQLQRRTRYFKGLSKLNLRRNELSDSGIQSLCQAMTMGACESLTWLDLGDNHLTDRAIEDLLAAFSHQRLPNFEFLGLSGNYLTSVSVERLARCVVQGHCPKLQSIALRRNVMPMDPHELFLKEIRKAQLWQDQEKYPHLVQHQHQHQPHQTFLSHLHHNPQQHIVSPPHDLQ